MLGIILLAIGGGLMLVGVFLLLWLSGRGGWSSSGRRDGTVREDWLFEDMSFVALVVAPLLIGAVMILFGLRELL